MSVDNDVIKVFIPRWGNFYFSARFDKRFHYDEPFRIFLLYETIEGLPVLPSIYSQLKTDLIRRSIHGTVAIEGNPLSEEEVGHILDGDYDQKGVTRYEQEILNLKSLYGNFQSEGGVVAFSSKHVKAIHSIAMRELETDIITPGEYRVEMDDIAYRVGDRTHGGTYTPPKERASIEMLMKGYCEWMNSESIGKLNPISQAALAHLHFGLIHPFPDGNGRTARILEASILSAAGYKLVPEMLSNFYYRNIDEYYRVFSEAEKNKNHDVTVFVEFVYRGIMECLVDLKREVLGHIKYLVYQEFYQALKDDHTITRRQHELLSLLSDNQITFSHQNLSQKPVFRILYQSVSNRTKQRDIKKLLELDLLKKNDDGLFELNMNALDRFK